MTDTGDKVLVTGGTGFVGSHLARRLADEGALVTVLGRRLYATPRVFHPRIRLVKVDLGDAAAIDAAVAGHDLVFHVGALSSPWGAKAAFERANVDGTRHVVEAALRHRVRRLVHVSSTSIFFTGGDRTDVDDNAPLPQRFFNDYARTKAQSEDVVRAAVDRGLDAVIVRARAVLGPGDTAILPRLVDVAARGRLPRIGAGDNVVDVTFVDNLVHALLLCRSRGRAGAAYTITDGEPVAIWPLLDEVLGGLSLPPPRRRVSRAIVDAFARASEVVHRVLPALGEPRLTRYGAALLSTSQTFDIRAARDELGYAPVVPTHEGVRRTVEALRRARGTDESAADVDVELDLLFTGHTDGYESHVLSGGEHRRVPFHSMVAVIRHPRFGTTLFDTGYASHFHDETARLPFSLYARVTPVTTTTAQSARAQLAQRGVHDVRRIVLSHFHGDHVAGLRDFPGVDVLCHAEAWRDARARTGLNAVRKGIVPRLLPEDVNERLHLIEGFHDAGFGPFARSHDLFGDRSVLLVDLSGHAPGQLGALVQVAGRRKLLAADAVWLSRAIREEKMPGIISWPLMSSSSDYRRTLRALRTLHERHPDVEIIPTHCPEVFARYGGVR
jgi:nucleoside-diphosphate-sugar epimerase/glyoxylase-like metal-dependent hydrolase (beta-lactamase superfamily II)